MAVRPARALAGTTVVRAGGWSGVRADRLADESERAAVAARVVAGQRAWLDRHAASRVEPRPTAEGVRVLSDERTDDVRARLAGAQAAKRAAARALLGALPPTGREVARAAALARGRVEFSGGRRVDPASVPVFGEWTPSAADARHALAVVGPDLRSGRVTGRARLGALAVASAALAVLRLSAPSAVRPTPMRSHRVGSGRSSAGVLVPASRTPVAASVRRVMVAAGTVPAGGPSAVPANGGHGAY